MSLQAGVVELLVDLAGVLDKQAAGWYLFGAQASNLWGTPRLSADVDVTALVEQKGRASLLRSMHRAGFDLRVKDTDGFARRTRVLPFVHRPSGILLDVVLAGPGLEEEFLRRARPVDIGPLTIPVLSPEDLLVTKILAGRTRDLDDIDGILRVRLKSLNLALVRRTLGELQKSIGQTDLKPLFEQRLTAIRRTKTRLLRLKRRAKKH